MSTIAALYKEDRHPADRGLFFQRQCHAYWRWIISPLDPNQHCLAELAKRVVSAACLIFLTPISWLVGLGAIALKGCFPIHSKPGTTIPVRPASKTIQSVPIDMEKVWQLYQQCQRTHFIQLTGVANNGAIVMVGKDLKKTLENQKTVFYMQQDNSVTTFYMKHNNSALEYERKWGITPPQEEGGPALLTVSAPTISDSNMNSMNATFVAFPHQGFHAQQTMNRLPMQQIDLIAEAQKLLKKCLNSDLLSMPQELYHLIVEYAIPEPHVNTSRSGITFIDHTQGVVTLSKKSSHDSWKAYVEVHGAIAIIDFGSITRNDHISFSIKIDANNPQTIEATYVTEVPGMIRLTVESRSQKKKSEYFLDLNTFSETTLRAYHFCRPAKPLTKEEMFVLSQRCPDNTVVVFAPRLGVGKASDRNDYQRVSYIKPGMKTWGPISSPDSHLNWSIAQEKPSLEIGEGTLEVEVWKRTAEYKELAKKMSSTSIAAQTRSPAHAT